MVLHLRKNSDGHFVMKQATSYVTMHRAGFAVLAALILPLCLAAGFVPFRGSFTNVGAALSLVALIEAIAILGNRFSGVVATISAAIWFDFFLTPPYERLTISRRPDLETTISILVIGVIVTEVAARSRRHRRAAGEESRFVAMLHDVTELCAGTNKISTVIDYVTRSLVDVLGLRACHFETDISGPPPAQIEFGGNVVHVGLHWPAHEIGIPGPEAEILCRFRGETVGRFALTPTPGLAVSRERRVVAVSMANLVAALLFEERSSAAR